MMREDDLLPATPAIRAAVALGLRHEVRLIERPRGAEEPAQRIEVAPQQLLKTWSDAAPTILDQYRKASFR